MLLEEKVFKYKKLQDQIRQLEEEKQKLQHEILEAFPKEESAIHVAGFEVKRYSRFSIKTSIEDARAFDATKFEEIIDKEKIKKLVKSGLFISDVSETSYFMIRSKKEIE